MAHRVCPWWLGYLLASPLRRLMESPAKILSPYVREGMTVLEPGPGMGFFTLELARMVGASGRVIAVDVQSKMLRGLERRARRAGLQDRIQTRLARPETLGIDDLAGRVDFTLAFALVHETPAAAPLFAELAAASRNGAPLLVAEPRGHVSAAQFEEELQAAARAGFAVAEPLTIKRSHAVLLKKK
jgi:SAM-dependent methyltransferase